MSSLPSNFTDELRARITLSEVIGKRVKIQRAGREYKACCPFHKEKTPSFTLNDQKGFYHCFGCGAHGDAIGFVMQHDNMNFMEAIEFLAPMAGLEVPKATPEEKQKFEKQKTLYDVLESATKWFENALFKAENRFALDYMVNRGISEKILREFRVGFAPDSFESFIPDLIKEGHSVEDLRAVGLTRQSTKGQKKEYAFFRGRVIFPVTDKRGRVVAFGGRIMPEYDREEGGFKPPKYLNSPDHDLFHKGTLLYNMSKARQACATQNQALIITEGYMDVIALAQAGIETAVAPLGTALTESQIDVAWQISPYEMKNPYLCFDGDNAGYRAAYRALERMLPMLGADKSANFVFLPEGEDPDTLVKKAGASGFHDALGGAVPFSQALWLKETEGRNHATPEEKAGLKKRLNKLVAQIQDKTVQEFYFSAVGKMIYEAFRQKKQPYIKRKNRSGGYNNSYKGGKFVDRSASYASKPVLQPRITKNDKRAEILLACMVNHPVLLQDQIEFIAEIDLAVDSLKKLRADLVNLFVKQTEIEIIDVESALKEVGNQKTLEILLSSNTYLHAPFAKKDADAEDIRNGWNNTVALIQKDSVIMDLRKTETQIASGASQDVLSSRLKSLGQIILHKDED